MTVNNGHLWACVTCESGLEGGSLVALIFVFSVSVEASEPKLSVMMLFNLVLQGALELFQEPICWVFFGCINKAVILLMMPHFFFFFFFLGTGLS